MTASVIDFETRSRIDLRACGAFRYAEDPTTEIFFACVVPLGGKPLLWVNPKFRVPGLTHQSEEALLTLDLSDMVYAHNALFEFSISAQKEPFKFLQLDQWRCTMAMARRAGLPPGLEKLGMALNLKQQKYARGKQLINLFSIPQDDGQFVDPFARPKEFIEFAHYCVLDGLAEAELVPLLKPFELTGASLDTFQFDLRMNARGIPVNVPALRNAQKILNSVEETVGKEFRELTGLDPTQRAKVQIFCQDYGVCLPDMQGDTLIEVLKTEMDPTPRRVLELYSKLSFAAVKKIPTMLNWVCADGRMRGVFTYYGAGTGRWSSGGPQLQNAKKATEEMRPLTHDAYKYICEGGDADGLQMLFGEPYDVLASCIRHFVHLPGQEMLDGDYAAIEARILCWLAGQEDALEDYRQGVDRYKLLASEIYQKPVSQITKDEREVGKRGLLGLGYQMGTEKFMSSCRIQYGIILSHEIAEKAKIAFRQTHDKVRDYWNFLDRNARDAINSPGRCFGPFVVKEAAGMPFLWFKLRSGRYLAYPRPRIDPREPTQSEKKSLAEGKKYHPNHFLEITYWGQIPLSTQWGRIKLYGGKLSENATQATAADFMAYGAIAAEAAGMPPFALIHDQGLAVREDEHTPEEFAAALATLPPWAKGMPLKVEAHLAPFYSKG